MIRQGYSSKSDNIIIISYQLIKKLLNYIIYLSYLPIQKMSSWESIKSKIK